MRVPRKLIARDIAISKVAMSPQSVNSDGTIIAKFPMQEARNHELANC
jgi:hypothetical protein